MYRKKNDFLMFILIHKVKGLHIYNTYIKNEKFYKQMYKI